MQRRAIPASERETRKAVITTASDVTTPLPQQGLPGGSGIKELMDEVEDQTVLKQPEEDGEPEESVAKLYVPILKQGAEERTITGVVLQPEVVDAQGDIYDANVVKQAAYKFLAGYNKNTKLGLMHKDFKPKFDLVESYLAPQELTINGTIVKEGSWLMTVKVLDDKVWEQVKKGKLTGFSIGGKARVRKLTPKAAA